MKREVHSIGLLAFPIRLYQTTSLRAEPISQRQRFTVVYGEQERTNLTYEQAAHEYGEAIMHALNCDGKIEDAE